MSFSELAIRRPFTVAVGFLIAVLVGAFSLTRLPIDLLPDITYPTLTVSSEYAGVGPTEIETLITRPIEETVAAVQGLDKLTSTSVEGRSNVRLSFTWGTDLDNASEEVRARLDRIRGRLPDEASTPTVFKFDLAATPILFLGVAGDLDPLALKRLADLQVKSRLERVSGVASVDVRGGLDREIRVEVDRQKLAALGLSLEQVWTALARENLSSAAGSFRRGPQDVGLRVAGEYASLAEIGEATVAVRDGHPIAVKDVAKVVDTHPDVTQSVAIDGRPGVQLMVRKQSGGNTVRVADAVLAAVPALNRDLRGVHVTVLNDTSRFIRLAIAHIGRDLVGGAILAIGVLLFFLRNVRSTLIVATAIPVSVITTFALLYFRDFSLNTMSMGGLALGIGRLVDDSIVVIENIYRHRALGKDAETAALDGTRQVSLAIVASTATTLAVFLPLIFLTGMTGVMFNQLSLVVVFALTCSLIVAQGLIPMLASKFLGTTIAEGERPRRFARAYDAVGRVLAGMESAYARSLAWVLDHAGRVAAAAAVLVVIGLGGMMFVGSEFMPVSDEGEVRVSVEMPEGTPLDVMQARFAKLEGIVRQEVPEAETLLTEIGGGGFRASGSNTGSLRVLLKPTGERHRTSTQIANALRRPISSQPGVQARVAASGGNVLARLGSADQGRLGVQVRGYDLATADRLTAQVKSAMEETQGLADVRASRTGGSPETVVSVDRAKAAAYGLNVSEVARALEAAMLGTRATMFREGDDEYPVVVRLPERQRQSLEAALDVAVAAPGGTLVALRDVVTTKAGESPIAIERENQERIVTVSAEPTGRDLGGTVARLRDRLGAIAVPADFSLVVTGDWEDQQRSFRELATALGLALLLVFLVMVAQFESLKSPFIIFFSVPTCVTGVAIALLLTGTTLNVQSFIGIIVLVGIAVSNGIVMVDFINQLREDGTPLEEAVYEGARIRLRPVLMTTACTILAMLPMALGLGEGSELQAPMARVVVGGLLTSTLVTLYLVPIVYRRIHRPRASQAPAREAPAASLPVFTSDRSS